MSVDGGPDPIEKGGPGVLVEHAVVGLGREELEPVLGVVAALPAVRAAPSPGAKRPDCSISRDDPVVGRGGLGLGQARALLQEVAVGGAELSGEAVIASFDDDVPNESEAALRNRATRWAFS